MFRMLKNIKFYNKILVLILVMTLLFILGYNLLHYDPILGYDAEAHHAYVDTFSRYLPREIHLPTDQETREFFNPPLTYLFPSAIWRGAFTLSAKISIENPSGRFNKESSLS